MASWKMTDGSESLHFTSYLYFLVLCLLACNMAVSKATGEEGGGAIGEEASESRRRLLSFLMSDAPTRRISQRVCACVRAPARHHTDD